MQKPSWLDADKLSSLGKKLHQSAQDAVTQLSAQVETNAIERGIASASSSSHASTSDAGYVAKVRELEELCQAKDDELKALKIALRNAAESSTGNTAKAPSNDEGDDGGTRRKEIDALKREVKKLADGKAWAEEECKEFEKECDDAREAKEKAEKELEELEKAKKALEEENERLRKQVEDSGAPGETMEETKPVGEEKEKKEDDSDAQKALKALTDERDRALKQVKSMQGVNKTLQQQLSEYAKRVPELERARDEVLSEKAEIAESLAGARADTDAAEKAKDELQTANASLEELKSSLQQQLSAAEAQVETLKKERDNSKQVQSDVEAAKQRVNETGLKKSLAASEGKLSIANELVSTMKADLLKKQSEIESLSDARDATQTELERLREEVGTLKGAVTERNVAMTELAELRTELSDAKRALEATSLAGSSLDEVEAARDKAEQELLVMAKRVAELEKQLHDAQNAQEGVAAELEDRVEATMRVDKDEIDRLRARCQELESAQAEASRAIDKLTNSVSNAEKELEESQERVKAAEEAKGEAQSRLEAMEIRIMNANALADASRKALEEFKLSSSESTRASQEALVAELETVRSTAEAAERDRDAWLAKCTEARETLEKWREKARKLMSAKDAELDAARGGVSPMRAKSRMFDDDDDDDDDENKGTNNDKHQRAGTSPPPPEASALSADADARSAYLSNVVKQFLLLPYDAHDRADALVPVMTAILNFPVEDEFRIRAHRASQKVKSQSKLPTFGFFNA